MIKLLLIAAFLIEKIAKYKKNMTVKKIWLMGNFPKKEIVHGLIEIILRTLNMFKLY